VQGFKIPLVIIGLVCPEARVKFKNILIFGLKPISPVKLSVSLKIPKFLACYALKFRVVQAPRNELYRK